MENPKYKYIYGPVSSWRLGKSLGIDPISSVHKVCTFDCIYCQAGRTEVFQAIRKIFVPTKAILEELQMLPEVSVDYITFAGNGEPTLAKNLGGMIRAIRKIRSEKIAVITNASLIHHRDVQADLLLADLVEAKIDAFSSDSMEKINHPMPEISWENVVAGLKTFQEFFKNRLTLQIMFVQANKEYASQIAKLVSEICPDEIEINTPLRACAVRPLDPDEIDEITRVFRSQCIKRIKIRSVYESKREKSKPLCQHSTERRRGKENL